jgi:hypothetical protein
MAWITGAVSICLAEYATIQGLALIALALSAYLYWTNFKEKRQQRRERPVLRGSTAEGGQAFEARRRARVPAAAQNESHRV